MATRYTDVDLMILKRWDEVKALRDVNLTLDAGDITVILGPSGSGKSTLLTLLGGLSSPSEGRVFCKRRHYYCRHLFGDFAALLF